MSKDIITDIEKQAGLVAHNAATVKNFKTVDELMLDFNDKPEEYLGVNYPARVEWLEANGYKLNRKNLLNVNLKTKTAKE